MPNGRSGGFIIDKGALKELLKTTSETTVVGGPSRPRDDAYVIVLEADPISVQQVNGLKTKIEEFAKQIVSALDA